MKPLKDIGWIGCGVMGAPMAGHLLQAGYTLRVHTRTKSKATDLLAAGALWCDEPASMVVECDVVFTMLGFPDEVRSVYLSEHGLLNAPGNRLRYVVDMTTSRPSLACELAAIGRQRRVGVLDAPVSGGDVGARNATLAIMVGGERDDFQNVRPLLEKLGQTIALMGSAGNGQHTKLCNQILVAGNMIGACESLLYARRAGLKASEVIDVIGKGAAASWAINNLGLKMVQSDFAPGFYVEHFVKDMGIALEECDRMDLSLPGLALVRQLYIALKAQGHARSGTQALIAALDVLNGG